MQTRALSNPNVCAACAESYWSESEERPSVVPGAMVSSAESSEPVEAFLSFEGPSVVECFDAVEQAKQAIAEVNAAEAASQKSASQPVSGVPKRTVRSNG
jgi:hypothetical protein